MVYNYNGIKFNLDQELLKKYEEVFLIPVDDSYIASIFSHPYKGWDLKNADPTIITEAVESRIVDDIDIMG